MKSLFAKVLYTGEKILRDSYVSFKEAQITRISSKPSGDVLGRYEVVTPAIIDPHSHIGMVRGGFPGDEGEANEHMDSLLALPDALDSVQMDDPAFAESVEMGVLYSCVVPGSGNIIGGLSAVIRNFAADTSEALVARAGVKCAFGHNTRAMQNWKGTRPNTRMGAVALLRSRLLEVRDKLAKAKSPRKGRSTKKDDPKTDLSAADRIIADILERKVPLRCHVHKDDDIASLLRLADEFGFRFTVEHAMGACMGRTFAELARRKTPVTYGPIDAFAYKTELRDADWRNVRLAIEAGIQPALMTDHPVTPSRQLLHQTRWLCRCGYTKQQAIETVTRRNAEQLGLADKLGTLKRGRWASLICWSGDPFDLTSYPKAVYGEGELVAEED